VLVTLFDRLLGTGCLATTLAACSFAQAPPVASAFPSEKTIDGWLLSGEPRLVAWGAHDTLLAGDKNLIPDLLSLASRWQTLSRQPFDPVMPEASLPDGLSPEQDDRRDAMAAVLDTLIQINVPVPADSLRALAPDFGNAVAVLLSRMPAVEAGPVSFDLYRRHTDHRYTLQYVSAALLALHPVPGFAADLLANIKVEAIVTATAPGSEEYGGSGSSGSCGPSSEAPRKGWPVTGQYGLSKQAVKGSVLLIAGVDPIYATRNQSTFYTGDLCTTSGLYLDSGGRLGLVAEMLRIPPERFPWDTAAQTTIEFQSLQQFYDDLLAFVEKQQEKYRTTVAALAERNLLTPSEAEAVLPELNLKLNDRRSEGDAPIPDPPNLPAHVEWNSKPFREPSGWRNSGRRF
jgi:hypothetical protein